MTDPGRVCTGTRGTGWNWEQLFRICQPPWDLVQAEEKKKKKKQKKKKEKKEKKKEKKKKKKKKEKKKD